MAGGGFPRAARDRCGAAEPRECAGVRNRRTSPAWETIVAARFEPAPWRSASGFSCSTSSAAISRSRSAMRALRSAMSLASSRMQRAAVRAARLEPNCSRLSLASSRWRSQRITPALRLDRAGSSQSAAVGSPGCGHAGTGGVAARASRVPGPVRAPLPARGPHAWCAPRERSRERPPGQSFRVRGGDARDVCAKPGPGAPQSPRLPVP
jgi:hypothetical protein